MVSLLVGMIGPVIELETLKLILKLNTYVDSNTLKFGVETWGEVVLEGWGLEDAINTRESGIA